MNQELKKIQNTELDILNAVHMFCMKHGIKYSLAYGTLLGAVRHKGFIPWDDDIDLMMIREEYDRFIAAWETDPQEGLFLQTDETDPPYENNFLKIRKNHTSFIQSEGEKYVPYHTGIFIDIFPVDRVAPKGLMRQIQYMACQINMLMTRNHSSGSTGFKGGVERILLSMPNTWKKHLKKATYKIKTAWNKKKNSQLLLFWNGTIHGAHKFFISDLFDELIYLSFEGKEYCAFKEYDWFLTYYFGDYMTLPPVEQRVTHHPLVVSFIYDYNELSRSKNNA